MNEQDRTQLGRLKEDQARLERELSALARQLTLLERRLAEPAPETLKSFPQAPTRVPKPVELPRKETAPESRPTAKIVPTPPPPLPPIIPTAPVVTQSIAPGSVTTSAEPARAGETRPASVSEPLRPRLHVERDVKSFLKGNCQSCGGHLEFPASAVGDTILCPHCGHSTLLSPRSGAIPVPPAIPEARPEASKNGSFEMRLGTYWLVRVGIVMVLTGLVFFGNLAYQNYIRQLGAGGKVALLYLASGILLGAGWWWQRKAVKESLRNYAQVLFAGGLAAFYFTTYAAHHIEPLRIIASPVLDGVLLLLCAGFMVWNADHRKSEVLALFAVGLAYYTSIITRVGLFTLYSNLVLTVAAVVFLVRNRWAALSFASLLATYAAYAFWRFFNGAQWHLASPEDGLWTGVYFLMSYWLVFTSAVFLSKDAKFAGQNRAAFLTLNNGAFFSMFVLTMWQVQTGNFWVFSLSYGGVLLVMAGLARWFLADEPLTRDFYLTQGLLLVTVGFIFKFTGLNLALVLAAESVLLLMTGCQRKNWVLLVGAYLTAGMSVGWGMDGMRPSMMEGVAPFEAPSLWLGMGLGVLMLWNAIWAHRQTASVAATAFRPQPAYFSGLALLIWLVATWDNTAHEHFPLVLAAEGVVLTLSVHLLDIRELSLLSQGYIVLAQVAWLANDVIVGHSPPWWNPVLLIGLTLFLSHWWQKQTIITPRDTSDTVSAGRLLPAELAAFWQALYALAIVSVFYVWLSAQVQAPAWLAVTSLLAIGLTAYGVFTRAWWLAIFGQIFLAVSAAQFAWQLAQNKPDWPLALAPMVALGLLSFGTVMWFKRKPDANGRVSAPLLQLAMLYRWVALAMSIWWVCAYIPERERIWLLALLGLWVFLWAGWKSNREALLFSAAFTASALALFWLPLLQNADQVYWPNLLVILVLLAQRQLARRLPDRYPLEPTVHGAVIVIGGLSLWRFLTCWVMENASNGSFFLTASWSALALALFTAGIVLRERVYRWLGLTVLGCALGRVVLFDVWKLETIYRVLSFMALGIVLLVLGFIYNKYQERLKEWL